MPFVDTPTAIGSLERGPQIEGVAVRRPGAVVA